MTQLRRHPDDTVLSLLAGGDLGPVRRWLVKRHLSLCQRCATAVSNYRHDREELHRASPVPEIDFDAMTHRIRVMADQQRIGTVRRGYRHRTAVAAVAAAAAVVALLAPDGGIEAPDRRPTAVDRSRPGGNPLELAPGTETQVTARGNLSVRAFHPGSGTMTVTEYYVP